MTTAATTNRRYIKDQLAKYLVAVGGVSVIAAILLIFFYLLMVVAPLFYSAEAEEVAHYPLASQSKTLHLAMEEQTEIFMRVDATGGVEFFNTETGRSIQRYQLKLPPKTTITSFADSDPARQTFALGLSNGQALVVKHEYDVSFPDNQRLITPFISYPLGEAPVVIDEDGQALTSLSFQSNEEGQSFAAYTADEHLILTSISREVSFLEETETLVRHSTTIATEDRVQQLLVDKDQQELYILYADGGLDFYSILDKESPERIQHLSTLSETGDVTAIRFLTGGISLLVGEENGHISQWFPVRNDDGELKLTRIRTLDSHKARILDIAPEFSRKGFLAVDAGGNVGVHHTTAERTVLMLQPQNAPVNKIAVSPRANAFIAEDSNGEMHFWRLHNEHPDVSWKALWGKVWYESYDEPGYIWQSSSASNDFEPKFSLTPLAFGTLKAAFYAMLIAVPLSIFGAIYTSQFMAPGMRKLVKPSIEIMEALPTVIIGFFAGLWLAPIIESHLAAIFALLILMPVGIIGFSFLWTHELNRYKRRIPEGWEAAVLVPMVFVIGWLAMGIGNGIEALFFDNNLIGWMSHALNIPFDQRNSIVVGFAMGFAVIPTIFSIAEDALFAVPKHLIQGSLALGATPWQTLVRVVILTASPGIFSAVMIGLGRAVGETMIVLMATGNTAVMDMSLFQGMRTLSANIAVEMPESEVGSTHYRVLFLAALVLFAFTFIFNTMAELIRQRLRRKYSSL